MRKLLLLITFVFACGISNAVNEEKVCRFYDESEVHCSVRLPEGFAGSDLIWQLITPRWRVMAQGRIKREAGKNTVDIPLKFDKLKPGITLKCILSLKYNGKIVSEQKITVYSREILRNISGRLKNAAAFLPADEIAKLNKLGLELPEKTLASFDSPGNRLIFCEAKKYLDNVGMLSLMMKRGVTMVMLAPNDESEVFLPLDNFSKITLIASKTAKVNGALSVISNKEKIAVTCAGGQGDLVIVEYLKGEIIIVAAQVFEVLDKFPEAALLLKENLTK